MRKGLIVILALCLVMSLAACGNPAPADTGASPESGQTSGQPDAASSDSPAPAEPSTPTSETPASTAPAQTTLRLATTTSVNDSGLLDALRPEIESATGLSLEIISQGTGQAIKTGESGDADVLLIHSKADEEKFVENGFGVQRIELMYNYFVIVGPAGDPAGVKDAKNAAEALSLISKSGKFVSRGDDSGTHKKELKLWEAASVKNEGDWYISAGKGMGDTLTMASELQAYALTDKATYLSMKDKLELDIVLGESDDLKNVYSIIAVSPDKYPDINNEGANAFIAFMTGDKGKALIAEYGKDKYGEALFFLI